MKSNLFIFSCLLTCSSIMISCDKALEDNLPSDYASVVHFKGVEDQPETEVKLLLTGEDEIYEFEIGKGGNDPKAEASVDIKVMTDEEMTNYNNEWNTDYHILPSKYYSFSETSLKFSSEENIKKVQIIFNGVSLQELVNDDTKYVIPITLSGIDTRVHQGLHQSILKVNISVPTITLDMPEEQKIEVSINDEEADKVKNVSINAFVDLNDNKWSFSAILIDNAEVMNQLINDYKESHSGTSSYELLPASCYQLPTLNFTEGTLVTDGTIRIDVTKVNEEKNYILPIKLDKCEGRPFNLDDDVFYIHVYVRAGLPNLEIDENNILTTSFPSLVNYPLSNMFDGDSYTYWESDWAKKDQKSEKYGVWLDINLQRSCNSLCFEYTTHSDSPITTTPKVIHIYVYNDELDEEIEPVMILSDLPNAANKLYVSQNYISEDSFNKVKIAIVETYERPQKPGSNGWTGFAELKLYGQ